MIGLGLWEIVFIIIAGIVFIRPKDLPAVARKVGALYARCKEAAGLLSDQLKDVEEDFTDFRRTSSQNDDQKRQRTKE